MQLQQTTCFRCADISITPPPPWGSQLLGFQYQELADTPIQKILGHVTNTIYLSSCSGSLSMMNLNMSITCCLDSVRESISSPPSPRSSSSFTRLILLRSYNSGLYLGLGLTSLLGLATAGGGNGDIGEGADDGIGGFCVVGGGANWSGICRSGTSSTSSDTPRTWSGVYLISS